MKNLRTIPSLTVRSSLLSIIALCLAALLLGCGSSEDEAAGESRQQQAALSRYHRFLRENSTELSRQVKKMRLMILKEAGKEGVPGATLSYLRARLPLGHIAPTSTLFPVLYSKIDGLEEEVPPDEYGGFHAIEKGIFWETETSELNPFAKQLENDIEELRKEIGSAHLSPARIVAGAGEVVDSIISENFPGTAERWSHMDMLDAAAEVEGIDAALRAVKPRLTEENQELMQHLEAQLEKAYVEVEKFGAPENDPEARPETAGLVFIVYDQVTQRERWESARPFKQFAELLSEAENELANS